LIVKNYKNKHFQMIFLSLLIFTLVFSLLLNINTKKNNSNAVSSDFDANEKEHIDGYPLKSQGSELVFFDGFEDDAVDSFPSGWTQMYSGQEIKVVSSPVYSGSRALKMKGGQSWVALIYYDNLVVETNFTIECYFYIPNGGLNDEGCGRVFYKGIGVYFDFNNSQTDIKVKTGSYSAAGITPNAWHHLKVEYDWDNEIETVYIDSNKKYSLTKSIQPSGENGDNRYWLSSGNDGRGGAIREIYFDNCSLFNSSDYIPLIGQDLSINTSGRILGPVHIPKTVDQEAVFIYAEQDSGVLKAICANGTILWEKQLCLSSFKPSSISLADFTGDEIDDIIIAYMTDSYTAGYISIYRHDGFSLLNKSYSDFSQRIGVGDLNNDGLADFSVGFCNSPKVEVYNTTGSLLWSNSSYAWMAWQTAIHDIDNDGYGEVIVMAQPAPFREGDVYVYEHTGEYKWYYDAIVDGMDHCSFGDLTGDNKDDLLFTHSSNSFALNSNGSFLWSLNDGTYCQITDIDKDGQNEAIISGSNNLTILAGNGTILWQKNATRNIPYDRLSNIAVDIQGDEKLEIPSISDEGPIVYDYQGNTIWNSSEIIDPVWNAVQLFNFSSFNKILTWSCIDKLNLYYLSNPSPPVLNPITPNPNFTGSVNLDWNDITDVDNYEIYRYTSFINEINASVPLLDTATQSNYIDNILTNDTYYYVVVAVNESGSSNPSNCESVNVIIDTLPPESFSVYSPTDWIIDQTPPVIAQFYTELSGVDRSSVQYAYSTSGALTPTNWVAVDEIYEDSGCIDPAEDGDTGWLYTKVDAVPFNQESGTLNTIRFRANDTAGNDGIQATATTILISSNAPAHFNITSPIDWVTNQTPTVIATFNISAAGLDRSTVQYAYSTSGDLTPTNWAAVDEIYEDIGCTDPAEDGDTGWLYVKVDTVLFNQDSGTLNAVRFRAMDLGGKQGTQANATVILIDSSPPDQFNIIQPTDWVNNQTPDIVAEFFTGTSGVNRSSVQYAYSTSGALTPANWVTVDEIYEDSGCTDPAEDGDTGWLYIKVNAVSFNQDSDTLNTIRFRAKDIAGNDGIQVTATVIKVDTVLPKILYYSHTPQNPMENFPIDILCLVTDNGSLIDTVSCYNNRTGSWISDQLTEDNVDCYLGSITGLSAGTIYYRIEAYDKAGNLIQSDFNNITVKPCQISITNPINDSIISSMVKVIIDVNCDWDPSNVQLQLINGSGILHSVPIAKNSSSGFWEVMWNTIYHLDGTYILKARANFGYYYFIEDNVTVHLNNGLTVFNPQISVEFKAEYTPYMKLQVSGTGFIPNEEVFLFWNDSLYETPFSIITDSGGNFTFDGFEIRNETAGTYEIDANSSHFSKNQVQGTTIDVIVKDNTAPIIDISEPNNHIYQQPLDKLTQIQINFSAADDTSNSSSLTVYLKIFWCGSSSSIYSNNLLGISLGWNLINWETKLTGNFTIEIEVYDEVGNNKTIKAEFSIQQLDLTPKLSGFYNISSANILDLWTHDLTEDGYQEIIYIAEDSVGVVNFELGLHEQIQFTGGILTYHLSKEELMTGFNTLLATIVYNSNQTIVIWYYYDSGTYYLWNSSFIVNGTGTINTVKVGDITDQNSGYEIVIGKTDGKVYLYSAINHDLIPGWPKDVNKPLYELELGHVNDDSYIDIVGVFKTKEDLWGSYFGLYHFLGGSPYKFKDLGCNFDRGSFDLFRFGDDDGDGFDTFIVIKHFPDDEEYYLHFEGDKYRMDSLLVFEFKEPAWFFDTIYQEIIIDQGMDEWFNRNPDLLHPIVFPIKGTPVLLISDHNSIHYFSIDSSSGLDVVYDLDCVSIGGEVLDFQRANLTLRNQDNRIWNDASSNIHVTYLGKDLVDEGEIIGTCFTVIDLTSAGWDSIIVGCSNGTIQIWSVPPVDVQRIKNVAITLIDSDEDGLVDQVYDADATEYKQYTFETFTKEMEESYGWPFTSQGSGGSVWLVDVDLDGIPDGIVYQNFTVNEISYITITNIGQVLTEGDAKYYSIKPGLSLGTAVLIINKNLLNSEILDICVKPIGKNQFYILNTNYVWEKEGKIYVFYLGFEEIRLITSLVEPSLPIFLIIIIMIIGLAAVSIGIITIKVKGKKKSTGISKGLSKDKVPDVETKIKPSKEVALKKREKLIQIESIEHKKKIPKTHIESIPLPEKKITAPPRDSELEEKKILIESTSKIDLTEDEKKVTSMKEPEKELQISPIVPEVELNKIPLAESAPKKKLIKEEKSIIKTAEPPLVKDDYLDIRKKIQGLGLKIIDLHVEANNLDIKFENGTINQEEYLKEKASIGEKIGALTAEKEQLE
jgi:hypothetical protein